MRRDWRRSINRERTKNAIDDAFSSSSRRARALELNRAGTDLQRRVSLIGGASCEF